MSNLASDYEERTRRLTEEPESATITLPLNQVVIEEELERVLSSKAFRRAQQLSRLLRHLVIQASDGNRTKLNEHEIAVSVFGKPDDFNPRVDPLVRVQVGRLRRRLAQYYRTEGTCDPVVIAMPARGYRPEFFLASDTPAVAEPENESTGMGPKNGNGHLPGRAGLSIAVLPFTNMTGDESQAQFCHGLTEELISAMTPVAEVNVVSRTSVFQFKDESHDIRRLGRELGVKAVLEGSVRMDNAQVRTSVSLISTSDGFTIWSDSFDAKLQNAIEAQEELALTIAEALKHNLTAVAA